MRTRTKGVLLASDGSRTVDKEYKGKRIHQRLGAVSQDNAEAWLRERQAQIDIEVSLRKSNKRLWADAAEKYLMECKRRNVASIEMISRHITDLLPYIGNLPLDEVSNDTLEAFKLDRMEGDDDGKKPVKNSTINRTLEVVRTTLIRAARVWREDKKPWLATAPLIEMLDESAQKRKPYPITRAEQAKLLLRLPAHLQETVEFSVNTGARDENVCGLQWKWEVDVPEIKRSVFVIPAECFKTNRPHVLMLNDAAWAIIQRRRGQHPQYVFTYKRPGEDKEPNRLVTQNNSAFQKARADVGLSQVRVHDLRHTFGQRLRDAGVTSEDRSLLLGHAIEGMSQHYAVSTLERMLEAANSVLTGQDRTMVLRVVNG